MGQVNMSVPGTLIIHRGALGDLLGVVPTLQAIRSTYSSSPIKLLGRQAAGKLLRRFGCIDELYDVEGAAFLPLFSEREPNAQLREWLSGFRRVVAWINDPDDVLRDALAAAGMTQAVVAPPFCDPEDPRPHSTYLAESVAPLELDVSVPGAALRLSDEDRALGAEWVRKAGIDPSKPIVALHPGSGGKAKVWSHAAFLQVASTLRDSGLVQVVFVFGPAEVEAERTDYDWSGNSSAMASMLPLSLVAAIAAHCTAWVGNDTGTTHLAAMMGVPTIALFGKASNEFIWAPRGERVHIVPATCGPNAEPRPGEVRKVLEHIRAVVDADGI